MTLGKVVDHFVCEYKAALNNSFVIKPMSYALYQTWKWLDDHEKPRSKGDAEECSSRLQH